MASYRTCRLTGLVPACLLKAACLYPVAIELLVLAAVAGMFVMEVSSWVIP